MKRIRKFTALLIAIIMMASNISPAFATSLTHDSPRSDIINSKDPVRPAKLKEGEKSVDFIKNPDQPDIYTLRTDYKVQRGERYNINYQPYIASVGAAASPDEQKKVKKEITLPDLAGYDKSQLDDSYTIDYDTVKNAAENGQIIGNDDIGYRKKAWQDYKYKAKPNQIKVKHIFQSLEDFSKYTNPDGSQGEKGQLITSQNGNTGSTMEVSPLDGPEIKGFVPEQANITMRVPEDSENFVLEYRYNRDHFDVTFDSAGGTALPSRTLYYEQIVPKIDDNMIPKKDGCEFLGWKPSIDLQSEGGETFKANEIIKDANGKAILNLDAKIKMPASKITFTAVWKDKEKADYAIQFWAEKADHADGASILEKYDYMGTHVHKDADTGSRPDLDNEPVDKIVFPDLDQARLDKIWKGEKFYGDKYLLLNKFYVYNKDLTADQNKDPKNVNLVKSVDATGKTVYNIYYDRQVYDLYFTKSNVLGDDETFYPEIYVPDGEGGAKLAGGPGNLYHYTARFNELMLGWPNDAMQTKGFDEGKQSYGWGPNYGVPQWPLHLDTPPYRLNADEFLDMPNYDNKGGYVSQIDKGDGTFIDVNNDPRYKDEPYRALSFGIKQEGGSMPHHMDFWMDGFKDGETIIRYDLYRSKADTNSLTYGHRYSRVQGFTPYGSTIEEGSEEDGRVNADGIDALNEEREGITPLPDKEYMNMFGFNTTVGQMNFMSAFFNNADDFGDPLDGVTAFKENGYIRFKYKRNKYPLRFNYDPSVIKDDSEFNEKNSLDTFYEFPLKVLNPELVPDDTPREDREYFKEDPKNFLDNPENLKQLGLTDLVWEDPADGKLKVKRPDDLSDQMVFKGWALDPAGTKLIWENPKEKMPTHALNLYAKWGEPDYKWKVTFDPDGGSLKNLKEESITQKRKTIQEGDIGQEEVNTYAKKEDNEGNKQVFTVIQRQKLVEPKAKPVKKGYDFLGWEIIRFKKNDKGDYTDEVDNSYRETYKVPELYTFGNDVVSPIYLKAIWVPNQRVDIDVEHYMLDKDYKLDENIKQNPIPDKLEDKRSGYLVATTGDRQDDEYILAPHTELEEHLTGDLKTEYEKYNKRVGLNNSFFQTFRVEPEKKLNTETNKLEDNPDVKNNVFKFFYRPYRKREYTVNYLDEKGKSEVEKFFKELELTPTDGLKGDKLLAANQANKEKFENKKSELDKILEKYQVVGPDPITNGNRHYDAINYRPIAGWVLTSKPQQQLFFDLNEETNDFLGINGTGSDQIFFYYKDVRVIEVPKDDPVPDNYVRVTYKIDENDGGGSFGKDEKGNEITELHYNVIKGLKSNLLLNPTELKEGEEKDADRYYITPDTGKKFTKWANSKLLNDNTIISDNHTFTAYFEWSGLSASGLVRTEAFKDPDGKWTNDFAPKIDDIKKQLVWKEKDVKKDLPAGTKIQLFDEKGNELTKDEQVYELVNEKKAADKDELIRTVNIKAKVTFTDGKDPQELDIPITVYKNVYEALTGTEKPLFLSKAEKGDLKDITGDYVRVTVAPTGDLKSKDNKVYYVNTKAWVEIPEVDTKDNPNFTNWTANQDKQNEGGKANGIYDFAKRHKFTEDTIISPRFADDVVEQEDPKKKPDVPDSYVKVIVRPTDKAKDQTEKTFWVNPTREVAINLADPDGKTDQEVDIPGLGKRKVNYVFKEWQKVQTGEADDKLAEVKPPVKINLASHKYTDKVTVIEASYKKSIQPGKIEKPLKTTKLDVPQGKKIEDKDLFKQITPQEGKEIDSITVIENPDTSEPGTKEAKVIVKYKDGSTQGTDKEPVKIPVEVHKNIIPEAPGGQRPKDALENYVKVIFIAGTGGSVSGETVYYVSPEVEVDMTKSAAAITKTPETGYFENGENWTNKDNKTLKGTFTDEETEFVFNFDKYSDIVPKSDNPAQVIPEGYVKVTFKTEDEAKGTVAGANEKIYYVNPNAGITLKVLGDNEDPKDKQLAVPTPKANDNFAFKQWQEAIDETNPITSERVHVAIFKSGQVTLTYNAGEGTGTVPETVTVDVGTKVSLANADGLSKANAKFAGWKLDGDETIYQPGDQVTLDKSRTATAQWEEKPHTVKFVSRGIDIGQQEVKHNEKLQNVNEPKVDGQVFMGWKEKESDTEYFDLTTPITEDKTLVAIWRAAVQVIDENATVEDKFIKVTFKQGDHGKLNDSKNAEFEQVTYKIAKTLSFKDAEKNGMEVPGIKPEKYYKAKDQNSGWDKALDLTLETGQTQKVFTAQYKPIADVIPIDPETSDDDIEKEKPEGMVVVTFSVDENKAFMDGASKFYVKANTRVDIPTPVVHPRTLENDEPNDYEFNGWNFEKDDEGKYNFIFTEDTNIDDGNFVKPIITLRHPRSNAAIVYVREITEGATAYIEVIRGSNSPVLIEAVTNEDGDLVFKVPGELGGKLRRRDKIIAYSKLNNVQSDTREYRVR